MQKYTVLTPRDLDGVTDTKQTFALDVLIGLSETPKRLPSRYFYDDRGSELFERIMQLPEYYLTSSEYEILEHKVERFARLVDDESFNLVELGAGNGQKTGLLLNYFMDAGLDFHYVPIDISEGAMKTLLNYLKATFSGLRTDGIVAEYFDGLTWLNTITQRRNMVLMLGSNLGNFNRAQARVFLRSLWNVLNEGDKVVIGFDLKKDIKQMLQAYNDHEGVTREFNLNLLHRINRELGGNFHIERFQHFSTYDVFSGAMESYLVSLEAQEVYIEEIGQTFSFQAWEPIHTEYSYKYLESDIRELAEQTGFLIDDQVYDSNKYFVDSIWQVQKIEHY
jgi:dimethylhistidine N-methyltransferase